MKPITRILNRYLFSLPDESNARVFIKNSEFALDLSVEHLSHGIFVSLNYNKSITMTRTFEPTNKRWRKQFIQTCSQALRDYSKVDLKTKLLQNEDSGIPVEQDKGKPEPLETSSVSDKIEV